MNVMNSPAEDIFIRKSSRGLFPLSGSKHRPYWHTEEIEDESKGRGQNRRSKVETTAVP